MADRLSKRFKIRRAVPAERMSAADYEAAERLLAKMVARRFAADHPELFGRNPTEITRERGGGK